MSDQYHEFPFERLTHATHFPEFASILGGDPFAKQAMFRGRAKPSWEWRWQNRAAVEYHLWGDLQRLYALDLVWFSPMPHVLSDAAGLDSPDLDSDLVDPADSLVPQVRGARSRYGEFSLSFEKEQFFEAYVEYIREPFVIYKLPQEAYRAERTETYLVCPHTMQFNFQKIRKKQLKWLSLPTPFTFVPGCHGHTWTNIQLCFFTYDGGDFAVPSPGIDFVGHEHYFDRRVGQHRPLCVPYKHRPADCTNMSADEASAMYDRMVYQSVTAGSLHRHRAPGKRSPSPAVRHRRQPQQQPRQQPQDHLLALCAPSVTARWNYGSSSAASSTAGSRAPSDLVDWSCGYGYDHDIDDAASFYSRHSAGPGSSVGSGSGSGGSVVAQRHRMTPCRYFRAGNCRNGRKCPYRHDYAHSAPNCRYYHYSRSGYCKFGDDCRFRHAEPRFEEA